MRRKRAWEIGASVALLMALTVAAATGYGWHLRRQKLNARLVDELARPIPSAPAVRLLLSEGADIRTRGPSGETVLTAAVWADDLSLATHALDSGVSLNPPGRAISALFLAAGNGRTRMVELLLARGAIVDERDPDVEGMTALMRTAARCRPSTVRTLLSAGADATLRDNRGQTALDLARGSIPNGRAETVRLLEDALARNRSARQPSPRSPLKRKAR